VICVVITVADVVASCIKRPCTRC